MYMRLYNLKTKTHLLHEKPRWFGEPVPPEHQGNINIKANGKPVGLYLIIKEQGRNFFYIFSDDSYTGNSFEPLKENLRLKARYLVSKSDCGINMVGIRIIHYK